MSEQRLNWLQNREDVFRYLFAQCLGEMAGAAYREFCKSGNAMSATRIAEAAEKVAEAGVARLEARHPQAPPSSPQGPIEPAGGLYSFSRRS